MTDPPAHTPDPQLLSVSQWLLSALGTEAPPVKGDEWLMDEAVQRPGLILVLSRPSMGRSAFLHRFLLRTKRERVLFSPLLPSEQVILRLIAMLSGIPATNIRNRTIHLPGCHAVFDAVNALCEDHLTFSDQTTLDGVLGELRERAALPQPAHESLPRLFLIDDLETLVHPAERGLALNVLQAAAHQYNCTVLVSGLLGRGTEMRKDHRPLPKDFREILQGQARPDTVITLYRDAYYHFVQPAENLMEVTLYRKDDRNAQRLVLEFIQLTLALRSAHR